MNKLIAYLLERRDGVDSTAALRAATERVRTEVLAWLEFKGGVKDSRSGTFLPLDGSKGTYVVDDCADGDLSWWILRLQEDTVEQRRFETSISITAVPGKVTVYVTLESGWTTAHIAPIDVEPRCPKVVRNLLQNIEGRWYNGASSFHPRRVARGFDEGMSIASEILAEDRTLPLVVVSLHDDDLALPSLDAKLTYDLAGLANVVVLDHEAAWGLTDTLGIDFCCHSGAVRLYWPHFASNRDRYRHPLWTRGTLLASGEAPEDILDRFRAHLRRLVFRASALSIVRPREADAIRDAVSRRALNDLRERAHSLEEYRELADSYAKENDGLRAEREDLVARVERLELQLAKLEAEKLTLAAHLRSAGARGLVRPVSSDEIFPDIPQSSPDTVGPPEAGEVRFYKKVHAAAGHDVMVRVSDCGCNKWQPSHAADKARKGVARLEDGRTDWRSMQHCASCTGGGMWRVKW